MMARTVRRVILGVFAGVMLWHLAGCRLAGFIDHLVPQVVCEEFYQDGQYWLNCWEE